MLGGKVARVEMSGGTGPVCAVFLVNIQLTGWSEDKSRAEGFAEGFNRAASWMQKAMLSHSARRTVSGQEAEPVCWITREQLTRVEDEGEDAWVYWAETGHVAEPDEVALYAAPIPATEQEKS